MLCCSALSGVVRTVSVMAMAAAIAMVPGCKRASLEFIPGFKKERSDDDVKTNPKDPKNIDSNTSRDGLPSAQLEILRAGSVIAAARVSEELTMQPSAASVDGDDRKIQDCVNAGLVEAIYDFGDGSSDSVKRSDCRSLAVGHRYKADGVYKVTLTVKSDEDESASDEKSLTIVVRGEPLPVLPVPSPTTPTQIPGQNNTGGGLPSQG